MPPANSTPRKRSSAVPPLNRLSPISNGPMMPSEMPFVSKASMPAPPGSPSVRAMPTFVGSRPSTARLKLNVTAFVPVTK